MKKSKRSLRTARRTASPQAARSESDSQTLQQASSHRATPAARIRSAVSRVFVVCALVAGLACVSVGLLLIYDDLRAESQLAELASSALQTSGEDGAGEGNENAVSIDWESLYAQLGDNLAGWLVVENTAVNYPVMQSGAGNPDYYLNHDAWGNVSSLGAPYLDATFDPNGENLVIYGHRASYGNAMFRDLSNCFNQEDLNSLSGATWTTQQAGTTEFEPLCAMKVDKNDTLAKQSSFATQEEMREWLAELVAGSSACAADASELAATATRTMVLATCSGRYTWGANARTVVVFVACE